MGSSNRWISTKGLIYASTTFGSRMMSGVFLFYYVKVFLDRYHMSQVWFQASQTIYAIWNAVNDPWFAYLQDSSPSGWIASRRKCILYGALPWVLSSLIPWFPWANYSAESNQYICFLQGLTALCLFDTFFTFCLLAHCALMTEYAETEPERLRMVKYMGVAGIFGSSSVFFVDYFSAGLKDYGTFQMSCVVIAMGALAAFSYTGKYATTKYDDLSSQKRNLSERNLSEEPIEEPVGSYFSLTKDIFKNKNFRIFVMMNFLQELHITYVMSFAKMFSEQLIPAEELSISSRSWLLGSLMVAPQVLVVAVGPIIEMIGLFKMELASFYAKAILGCIMYFFGNPQSYWYLIFLIVDFTLSDGMFTFFSVNLSEIAEEDQQVNGRKKPIASMIFGSNALVVKPALSLSPMIVAGYMDSFGYREVIDGSANLETTTTLHSAIFAFSCFAPIIIGLSQILIWRNYTLKGDAILEQKD